MEFYVYITLAFLATCYAEPATKLSKFTEGYECASKNGYYPIAGNCDSYVYCRDHVATPVTCPDGLHYNPEAKWPEYPCGYPSDVPCLSGTPQLAKSTSDCPHQYGYFPSPLATTQECGHYRLCVDGLAIEQDCPIGLAFDAASGRCDWPDVVPTCNAEEFLGFTCPPAPVDEFGVPLETSLNYKYPNDCYYFFSCQLGHARLLACDYGFAFDPIVGRCVDEEYVTCEHPRA